MRRQSITGMLKTSLYFQGLRGWRHGAFLRCNDSSECLFSRVDCSGLQDRSLGLCGVIRAISDTAEEKEDLERKSKSGLAQRGPHEVHHGQQGLDVPREVQGQCEPQGGREAGGPTCSGCKVSGKSAAEPSTQTEGLSTRTWLVQQPADWMGSPLCPHATRKGLRSL